MSRPVAIMLALVVCVALAPSASALTGPKIVFDKTEIVLPNTKEGVKVTAQFPFSNQGDMNLIIDQVSPSCGCTVPAFDKVTPPGKKGVVSLVLDTEGITGAFRKQAVVATNDSANPFVTLVLMGETLSLIQSDKGRRLELTGCLGDDIATTTILSDPEGRRLMIGGLENPMADYVEASLKALPGGKSYRLFLKSKVQEPMSFAGPLFFNLPGGPKVSLYLAVNVKGPYEVQPHLVFFGGLAKSGPSLTRSIQIKKACAEKLVLDKIIYNQEYFDVKTIWTEPGEKVFLDVTPRLDKIPTGIFDQGLEIQAHGRSFKVGIKGTVR